MSQPDTRVLDADRRGSAGWLTACAVLALGATAAWIAIDAVAPRRLATIDEGQWLFYADALAGGAVPYRDFWIQFGPLVLYGIAGAWSLFGETVAVARSTIWLLNAVGLLAAGVGVALVTRSWRSAALAVFLLESNSLVCRALMLNPAFAIRQGLALLALGLAAAGWRAGSQNGRRGLLVLSGAVAGSALLTSQEAGLFCLAALGGVALLSMALDSNTEPAGGVAGGASQTSCLLALACGAALPLAVWFSLAAASGALPDYLSVSFVDTFVMVSQHQRQALPGWDALVASGADNAWRSRAGWAFTYLPFALFAFAVGPARADWRRGDRGIALLLIFAVAFWSVNLGRSDRAHAAFAAGPAIALGVVLLAQSADLRRFVAVGVAAMVVLLWTAGLDRQLLLASLASETGARFSADFPRSGGARIRSTHAARLRQLATVADEFSRPGDPILVVPHDPSLYFLLDRRNPTRFSAPIFANHPADRADIVADVTRDRPALIVRTTGADLPGVDYDYYLAELEPVFEAYCRDPRYPGQIEIWLRKDAAGVRCAQPDPDATPSQ